MLERLFEAQAKHGKAQAKHGKLELLTFDEKIPKFGAAVIRV